MIVRRGDIIYIKDDKTQFKRPYLVISNDKANTHGEAVICVPLTKNIRRLELPTHEIVSFNSSMIRAEQIHTFLKEDIERIAWHLSGEDMALADKCVQASVFNMQD